MYVMAIIPGIIPEQAFMRTRETYMLGKIMAGHVYRVQRERWDETFKLYETVCLVDTRP